MAEEKIFYIHFSDKIDEKRAKVLMSTCAQIIQQKKPDNLYFFFSSPGGSVKAGINLFNYLKSLPCKITMHNTGAIDSIATVIFLSGDERYAATGSSFLFHGVAMNTGSGLSLNLSQLKEILSSLEQDQNKIAEIISANCSITSDEIRALFSQGESKDVDFALSKGVIHEVRDPIIPANEDFVTITVQ